MRPKILVFAGSTREASFNKRLATAAAKSIEKNGGSATVLELNDYPMPFYDGDCEQEQGLPENARKFKNQLESHDGLIIVTPEYNGYFPAVLKNSIDWASRGDDGKGTIESFKDKIAAVLSASPGSHGGIKSLLNVRQLLTNLKVLVIPEQLAVNFAGKTLSPDGTLNDEKLAGQLDTIVSKLILTIKKIQTD